MPKQDPDIEWVQVMARKLSDCMCDGIREPCYICKRNMASLLEAQAVESERIGDEMSSQGYIPHYCLQRAADLRRLAQGVRDGRA